MLFNLGLTADAAAAHKHDFSPSESQLNTPTSDSLSPTLSFATLSSLGIGALFNKQKSIEISEPRRMHVSGMSMPLEEALYSSDGEYSTAGTNLARTPVRSNSVRKPSSRPKTSYQLAHPAGHARHKRLRLRPKLLLQVQQVSQTARPIPIVDVLPSTVYLPRLARKFPTIFRGKNGLGPNDLIVVTSELYERPVSGNVDRNSGSEEENNEHREVVATICQLLKEDARSKGKAEICLNYGPVWEATPLPNGSYEFIASTENGPKTLRWVLRGGKSRRLSGSPEDHKRFTFSVIDPNTRRHPVIASMTRNHLDVYDRYSIPSPSSAAPTSPMSPTSAMSVISDSSELDLPFDKNAIPTDDNLRALIMITGIWVAFREGWSHNFAYDDSVPSMHPKNICSPSGSKPQSVAAVEAEKDDFALPENEPNHLGEPTVTKSKKRHSSSSVRHSLTMPTEGSKSKSVGFGSLSQRSNSTGAAFLEKTNRRSASASNGRIQRHSMFSAPSQVVMEDPSRSSSPRNYDFSSRSRHGTVNYGDGKNSAAPEAISDGLSRGGERPAPKNGESHKKTKESKAPKARAEDPPKGKRRHRLSNIFDFIVRKSGIH